MAAEATQGRAAGQRTRTITSQPPAVSPIVERECPDLSCGKGGRWPATWRGAPVRRSFVPAIACLLFLASCSAEDTTVVSSPPSAAAFDAAEGFDDVSVAAHEAAESGRPVELVNLRTKNRKTFIRPDGQTLIERTDPGGQVEREVRNTPAIVLYDQRMEPRACNGGDGRKATSLTPSLSVTVADVDHQVRRSKVRLYFEVSRNEKTVASGYSAWVEPGERASWTVPAGALKDGRYHHWRARAEDGQSVSDWAFWGWQWFGVNLIYPPQTSCGGDDIGFDYVDVGWLNSSLNSLVEANPDLYQGYGAGTFGIGLYAVRQRGISDAQATAQARAAGQRAILANSDPEVTDEARRRAAWAMQVELVDFRADEIEATYEDLDARVRRKDPTLPTIADLQGLYRKEAGDLYVLVVTRAMTAAQEHDLRARYGRRIEIERGPADANWTRYEVELALYDINARRKAHDPTLPPIQLAFAPVEDLFAYVQVRSLSDLRVKSLRLQYGERIRVDDGSHPPAELAPDDAW
ncbi:MAG: hypothetical protein ACT4QF_21865 [Sporichthyaceae bacterium]